jgi:PAS domain S-box-containing protein
VAAQDDEDELLRSVALQNANAILAARQRAEQELIETKEALERKTEELAQSLAMMRATLESTTDAILVTDERRRVTNFNRKFVEMWRIPAQILASAQHREFVKAMCERFASAAEFTVRIDEIYSTAPLETFDVLELADGKVIERTSAVQAIEGRSVGRVWSFRDVTERRRDERRLTLALTAGRLGLWQFEIETRRLTCTAQCKANHGLPPDAELDFETDLIGSIDPAYRGAFRSAVQRAIETEGSFDIEIPNTWPDGSSHWLSVTGLFVDRTCMVGVTVDTTERRRTEEQLRHGEEALREANRHKDEFLAVLAHELRGPLAAVLMAARILQAKGPPDPILVKCRDAIVRQTIQLSTLVDDLLDIGRITSGKLRLDKNPVDVNSILKQAAETCAALIERRRHALNLHFADPALQVDADFGRVVQVVSNLLNNAAKYMNEGGRIDLAAAAEGNNAVIRVRDEGIGIPEEMLGRIFQRFVQVGGSKHAGDGLGIGLSVVKALIELHGGTVEAKSEGLGKGSEFIIQLPLSSTRE